MKVTLTSENGDVFRLEIGVDLTVQDLQALAELETAIPQDQMLLIHNMAPLADPRRPLTQYGVEEGDVIMVSRLEGGGVDPTTRPAVSYKLFMTLTLSLPSSSLSTSPFSILYPAATPTNLALPPNQHRLELHLHTNDL
jgi:hypothetical protein